MDLILPYDYNVINAIAGVTYSWTCIGGAVTSLSSSSATVLWDATFTGVYTLTAYYAPDCYSNLYLQDCNCPVPSGAFEIINLNDANFSSLADIANAIDPLHSSVQTVLIDHIWVRGATLFIRGQFVVPNTQIHFQDCTIYMDKGSVIFTPNAISGFGQKYDHCIIKGVCDNMWEGIRVGEEGHLQIENSSSLSDAEYGIRINHKIHISLKDSYFYRNYVTVYGEPLNNDQNTFDGLVENCEFEGSQTLAAGRYNGQDFAGQIAPNGRFPVPQNNRTFAAMELHNLWLGATNVGIPFSTRPSRGNVFHDLNVGIYGKNSYIDVFNCNFNNISYVSGYSLYGDFSGTAVYAETDNSYFVPTQINIGDYNTPSFSKSNTLRKVRRSVYLKGNLNSSIVSNTIDDNLNIAFEIKKSENHVHRIYFNTINRTRFGIFSNVNQHSTMNIEGNNITSLNEQRASRWLIKISDAGLACQANVINNILLSYSNYGIVGWNNEGSIYRYNGITMNHTSLPIGGSHVYGLGLWGGRRNTVDCNYSGGPTWPSSNFYNNYQRSFYFSMSSDNTVSCNVATKSYFGYEFLSNCNPTKFYGNSHDDLYDGLLMGDYFNQLGGDFGNQTIVNGNNSPGNLYYGRDNAGNFTHAATMTINSNPLNNGFWVNTGLYFPLTNMTQGGSPFNPIPASNNPYKCINCGSGGGGGSAQGSAESIVNIQSNPNSIDEELMKWDREKKLYEKLLLDSGIVSNSFLLQNFMDSLQYNNKGKFGELSNELQGISSEFIGGIPDSLFQILINAAENKNNSIVPEYSFEEAQKIINEILINTIVKGVYEFNNGQTKSIMEIANSCPFINGPAVFQARSLANFIDGELLFEDYDICSNNPALRKRNPVSSNEFTSIVYPNSASEKISIYYPLSENATGIILIHDILGALVFNMPVRNINDLTDIDIHALPSGIYSIELNLKGQNKLICKLSVVH